MFIHRRPNERRRLVRLALFVACGFASLSPLAAVAKLAEDPCTTVPRALVSEALHAPVVVAMPRTDGESRSCGYRTSPDGPFSIVTAFRYPTSAKAAADARSMSMEEFREHLQPPVVLRGYGDRAFSVGGKIYVAKGTALYVFGSIGLGASVLPDPSTERLARRVMAIVKR